MKMLFGTTALVAVLATSAFAQTAEQTPAAVEAPALVEADAASTAWVAKNETGDIHVSNIIGATIYAADEGEDTIASRADWESVGEVNDVLVTREGDVRAILVDVGTFLGMGGKTVAAPLAAIRYVADGPDSEADDYFLVIRTDRETLQGAPAYERPSLRAEDHAMTTMTTATSDAGSAAFTYDGYQRAENAVVTVSDIENATVYGHGDDKIGSISELVATPAGEITDAVIDVGGFLGMGARSVSMPFSNLTVLRKTDGDDVRVYIDATKESLEAMPRYEG